jgi:hypothetical protein
MPQQETAEKARNTEATAAVRSFGLLLQLHRGYRILFPQKPQAGRLTRRDAYASLAGCKVRHVQSQWPGRGLIMNSNRILKFAAVVGALLGLGALAACQTQQQKVIAHEDNLAAAGFIVRPANTPERQAMLNRLPAHQFVQRVNGDTVHYVYADPLVCGCLYVGTQQAFNQYKRDQQQKNLADEQQMTAQMYSDPAWSWNAWGPWGPEVVPYGFVYGPGVGW